MSRYQIKTYSEQKTADLAEKIAKSVEPGDVITLEGDLGAGKTAFTKGFADGLGVKRTVNSPTFTIIKEYAGRLPLYHMDVYRLEDSDEDIGFTEYFNGDGVTVVEWAQFIEAFLPEDRLTITMSYVNDHIRLLSFQPFGDHYEQLVAKALE